MGVSVLSFSVRGNRVLAIFYKVSANPTVSRGKQITSEPGLEPMLLEARDMERKKKLLQVFS